MADIKVEMSGEDINRAIADAVVKSVVGDAMIKVTREYVEGLSRPWDNVIKKIVDQEVSKQIVMLVAAREIEIRAEVLKQMTEEVLAELTTKAVDALLKRRDR